MGMYDSVMIECECGREVEFQSKAGDCTCARYNIMNVPHEIAGALSGEYETCECGKVLTIETHVITRVAIT